MWLIPSRERPHKVARFIRAYHVTEATTPFLVIVDETDPKLTEYRALKCPLLIYPGETRGMAEKVRHAYAKHPERPWYGVLVDDCEPVTEGWDKALIEAAEDKFISYCPHGVKRLNFDALPCIAGDLVRKIGYILPDCVEHYCSDAFWRFLAKQTGRKRWVPDHMIRLTDYITDEPWDEVKKRAKKGQPAEQKRFHELLRSEQWHGLVRSLKC